MKLKDFQEMCRDMDEITRDMPEDTVIDIFDGTSKQPRIFDFSFGHDSITAVVAVEDRPATIGKNKLIEKAKEFWNREYPKSNSNGWPVMAEFAEAYAAERVAAERDKIAADEIKKANTPLKQVRRIQRYNLCDDVNCLDDSPHRRH